MAFNTSSLDAKLTTYVDGSKALLISNAIFGQDTIKNMTLQTGVKATVPIVKMDTTINFGDGTQCGFTDSGDTTFTNRMLTPGFVKVNKAFCDKKLLNSWAAHEVIVAAGKSELPFEEKLINDLVKGINEKIEQAVWTGTVASDKVNGIITTLTADEKTKVIPAANVIAKNNDSVAKRVEDLWKLLPASMGNATIFMSVANFKALVLAYEKENNYHYEAKEDGTYEIQLPYGTNKVVGVVGMGTSDVIMATPYENLVYGVDLENDSEEFDVWYSKDNQEFRFACNFAMAVNYANPAEVFASMTKTA